MAEATGTVQELQSRVRRELGSDMAQECLARWAEAGLAERPRAVWFPRPVFPYVSMAEAVFEIVADGEVDAILFADERRSAPRHNLRDIIGHPCVPLVDLSGRMGEFADASFDLGQPETWAGAARQILAFRERRRLLAEPYRATLEPHSQLLAHAFVSGRRLTAKRYPQSPDAVCYPGFWSAAATTQAAERLVRDGAMTKTFFDRMHECRACSSRRLSAREECPSCHSPQLAETQLIHHYRCAMLAPEDRFRKGAALVCPKCAQHLRNYGKDYDKPGRAMCCGQCDKITSEPEVGFVCMDCSAEFSGDEVRLVDVYSYEITDVGAALLTRPAPRGGALLDGWKERIAAEARSMAIAEISYGARQDIVEAQGETIFERLRNLFIENMTAMLAENGEYRAGPSCDYFLLSDYDETFARRMEAIVAQSSSVLAARIEPRVRIATRRGRAA